jgi:hypothetical protein
LVVLITGCNKVKQLANINADIPYSTEVNVPQVDGYDAGIPLPPGGLELPSVTVGVATNSKEYLSQYGTAANMVTTVYLKSLSIEIKSPPNQNFDFLDNIQVYISAPSKPEILIASQNNIPKGASTLHLTTNTEANLKDYYVQETINLRLAGNINAVPPAGEVLSIASVFHLVANPLN